MRPEDVRTAEACQGRGRGRECACGPVAKPGSRMNRRTPAPAAAGIMTSRTVFALALFAAAAGIGLPGARLYAESANTDFKQGQSRRGARGLRRGLRRLPEGVQQGSQGRALQDRACARAGDGFCGAHDQGPQAAQAGDTQGALAEFLHAAEIDPSNEAAQQEIASVRQKQGESAPTPEIGLPEPPAEQQELESIGSSAGAEAGHKRAALAAHGRGRQGGLPGGGQGRGRQRAVRPGLSTPTAFRWT